MAVTYGTPVPKLKFNYEESHYWKFAGTPPLHPLKGSAYLQDNRVYVADGEGGWKSWNEDLNAKADFSQTRAPIDYRSSVKVTPSTFQLGSILDDLYAAVNRIHAANINLGSTLDVHGNHTRLHMSPRDFCDFKAASHRESRYAPEHSFDTFMGCDIYTKHQEGAPPVFHVYRNRVLYASCAAINVGEIDYDGNVIDAQVVIFERRPREGVTVRLRGPDFRDGQRWPYV